MPPPNVTGQLHMGHAMDNTLQDILTLIDNDSLKQKLSDLTSIYAGLDEQMAGRYHDSEDMMELAIKNYLNVHGSKMLKSG